MTPEYRSKGSVGEVPMTFGISLEIVTFTWRGFPHLLVTVWSGVGGVSRRKSCGSFRCPRGGGGKGVSGDDEVGTPRTPPEFPRGSWGPGREMEPRHRVSDGQNPRCSRPFTPPPKGPHFTSNDMHYSPHSPTCTTPTTWWPWNNLTPLLLSLSVAVRPRSSGPEVSWPGHPREPVSESGPKRFYVSWDG